MSDDEPDRNQVPREHEGRQPEAPVPPATEPREPEPRTPEPWEYTVDERADFGPVHDHYQRLWTPHRMVYIGGQDKPADSSAQQCPFCRIPAGDDEQGLVVARGERCYVVLNLYPYNSGHMMVLPYRHVSDYTELDDAETAELAAMTRTAMRTSRAVHGPAGFNIGMNQGEVAGAGIAAHLHQHVVPRWAGDANFLPIVGQTKALPELLSDTRRRLAEGWPAPEGATPA